MKSFFLVFSFYPTYSESERKVKMYEYNVVDYLRSLFPLEKKNCLCMSLIANS